ncbi:MAG: hypothetical protein WCA89_16315 [Terracidiphilus sp.]
MFNTSSRTVKVVALSCFSFLLLFLNFSTNFLHTADDQWFSSFGQWVERFVVARMAKSHRDGVFSSGGLLGSVLLDTPPRSDFEELSDNFRAYTRQLKFVSYIPHKSLIGGQGILFSELDKVIPAKPQSRLEFYHILTAFLSALAVTAIVVWFHLEFGLLTALLVLGSAVCSMWLTVYGRNLFYLLWAFYLPVIAVMFHLRSNFPPKLMALGAVASATVFVKCFFTGYDFITPTLVMMVVPLVYYSALHRVRLRSFLSAATALAAGACLAIAATFLILCFQIASVDGHFQDGINHIAFRFSTRTHSDFLGFPAEYVRNLREGGSSVLTTYVRGTYFGPTAIVWGSAAWGGETRLYGGVRYEHLLILFAVASGIGYAFRRNQKRLALILATWFSLLAPLSWFVIFKESASVHVCFDYIVWQMPFVFFGFAVCGSVVIMMLEQKGSASASNEAEAIEQ